MLTMLEQVTELNLMIMASSNRKIADLTPLSAPSMTPAVRTKLVVYSEVGVDFRALKGQLDLYSTSGLVFTAPVMVITIGRGHMLLCIL